MTLWPTVLVLTCACLALAACKESKFNIRNVNFNVELDKKSWVDALNSWTDGSKRLATIMNVHERDRILAIVRRRGLVNESFWVSGILGPDSHRFNWLIINKKNGEYWKDILFTNWEANEPKFTAQNQCVLLSSPDLLWKVENCAKQHYFISEQDVEEEQ